AFGSAPSNVQPAALRCVPHRLPRGRAGSIVGPMNREAVRGGSLLAGGRRFGVTPGTFARLFAGGFHKIIDRIDAGLETGSIHARLPDGSIRLLGGRADGFAAEIDLRDWRALLRLTISGSVGWYQAWEAGEWASPDPVPLFA